MRRSSTRPKSRQLCFGRQLRRVDFTQLSAAAELIFDLGLMKERRVLDSTMSCGQRRLDAGGGRFHEIIFMFAEKLSNTRGVDQVQLTQDMMAMQAIVEASGGFEGAGGGCSGLTSATAHTARYGAASRATTGRAAYPTTAPHQGLPPRGLRVYTPPVGRMERPQCRHRPPSLVGKGTAAGPTPAPPAPPSDRDL